MKFKLLNENLFFNTNNIEKDLEAFYKGTNNILLITGFSGSGKSTLAKELQTRYNATVFELDCLDFYYNDIVSEKELRDDNEYALLDFINEVDVKSMSINSAYEQYIKYIINWCKSHKGKYIIEGLQLYEYDIPENLLVGCSCIIIGTSGVKSALRAAKRNAETDNDYFGNLNNLLKFALKDNKKLNTFKNTIQDN